MFVEQSPEIELKLLQNVEAAIIEPVRPKNKVLWEVMRFALVGFANTVIDLLTLNCLLFFFPVSSPGSLVLYNAVAYSVGAFNSFILNKYWTFHLNQKVTGGELARFAIVNLFGIFCNSGLLWLFASVGHPFVINTIVWANASKILAIAGTAAISFLAMRLWVFAGQTRLPYTSIHL